MTAEEIAFMNLARTLAYTERVAEVAAMTQERLPGAIDGEASRDFLAVLFDLACRATLSLHGHTSEAKQIVRKFCDRSLRQRGEQPWTDLYEACLLNLDREYDRAVPLYLATGPEADILWPTSVGCRSVATLEFARQAAIIGPSRSKLNVVREGRSSGRFVTVTSADHHYLRRYGDAFLRSARRHAGEAVHLHLIDLAPDDVAFIETRIAAGWWPDLFVSTESYVGPDARAYYAIARFLHTPALLDRYGVPLLICDIDAVFNASLAKTMPLNGFDACLRFKRRGFRAHPWQTVQAGMTLLTPTTAGRRFCDLVGALASTLFAERRGQGVWFIDQNVLCLAERLTRLDHHDAVIAGFDPVALPGRVMFGTVV